MFRVTSCNYSADRGNAFRDRRVGVSDYRDRRGVGNDVRDRRGVGNDFRNRRGVGSDYKDPRNERLSDRDRRGRGSDCQDWWSGESHYTERQQSAGNYRHGEDGLSYRQSDRRDHRSDYHWYIKSGFLNVNGWSTDPFSDNFIFRSKCIECLDIDNVGIAEINLKSNENLNVDVFFLVWE